MSADATPSASAHHERAPVLIVEDDPDERELLCELLRVEGYEPVAADCAEAALDLLEARDDFAVLLSDVNLRELTGIELCVRARALRPDLPVVVMTGQADVNTAVAALRAGAWDFLVKPLGGQIVGLTVGRAIQHHEMKHELTRLRVQMAVTRPASGIVGESPVIRHLVELIARVADGDTNVLVTGESGTGKELIAQAIHNAGPRRDARFVAINCGAVPSHLLESELFGHVKGAFTDARRDRPGLFHLAGNGTIFLDEIGETPPDMQVKLLRVLQERRVRPVGGDDERPVSARVVCATNRDLEAEVAAGRFRLDLFYRVNVVTVEAPPLRARGGDVLLLAQHFLERIAARTGSPVTGLSVAAARVLLEYDWPGNVRELENCLERAVALSRHNEISVDDLPTRLHDTANPAVAVDSNDPSELITLAELESRYVRRVLAACDGNKTRAARILGIDRRSLYRRLEEGWAGPTVPPPVAFDAARPQPDTAT